MNRVEELKEIIKNAKQTLSNANAELTELLLTEALSKSEFKVGDRVTRYGKQHELVGSKLNWDNKPRWYGRLVRKDGTLGAKVFEMYGKLDKC